MMNKRSPHRPSVLLLLAAAAVIGVSGCQQEHFVDDSASAAPTDKLRGADLYTQGAEAFQNGDRSTALPLLTQAISVNPKLRMAQAMLGEIYRAKGNYLEAAAHFKAAAQLDPYSLSTQYQLGLMDQYIGALQDAATAYQAALLVSPRDLKSNMYLGTVYLALGQTDDALNYLNIATQVDPNSGDAWSNLGVALDAARKPQDAEKAYRKAIEINPSPTTVQNLAVNLVSQNRGAEAVKMLQSLPPQTSPSTNFLKTYGDALTATKQYAPAIAQYDAALKVDATFTPALNGKANCFYRQYQDGFELDDSQCVTAIGLWKQSLAINPNQPRVVAMLATANQSGSISNGK